jgi:hypothetical protein
VLIAEPRMQSGEPQGWGEQSLRARQIKRDLIFRSLFIWHDVCEIRAPDEIIGQFDEPAQPAERRSASSGGPEGARAGAGPSNLSGWVI